MSYKTIIVEKDNGVSTLTLNRPERLNALTPDMAIEIRSAVNELACDPETRVLVITGAGRGFCAGADVSPGKWQLDTTPVAVTDRAREGSELYKTLRNMMKPVIASVNGVAAGGGMGLALACDIIFASENARFGMTFIKIGIIPEMGGCYLLPRLVGVSKACELIFSGRIIDAREAERIGLVNRVVPPESLEAATKEFALSLAQGPTVAIGLAKRTIYQGLNMDFDAVLESEARAKAVVNFTEDYREAKKAFAEKRAPQFKGK